MTALERYDEAIQYCKEALSVDPDNNNAKNGLINLWVKLGNEELKFFYFDTAIPYFDNALEIDPTHLNALLSKAGAYADGVNQKKSIMSLQKICTMKFWKFIQIILERWSEWAMS